MLKISTKILYPLLIICSIAIFVIDGFENILVSLNFTHDLSFLAVSLNSLRNIFVLIIIIGWIVILHRRFLLSELSIPQKLWRLTLILGLNFVLALIFQLIFPAYTALDHPPPGSIGSIVFALRTNLTGLLAIFSFIPFILILRELIFYKQRRTTRLYFNVFLGLLLISTGWAFYNNSVLNFSNLFKGNGFDAILNIIFSWSLAIIFFLLSLRNDWITYLPRKQKFLYFGVGLVISIQIYLLNEYVYEPYVRHFSMIAANLGMITWVFMAIYSTVAMVTLLVHLPTARAVDRKLREVNSLQDFSRMLNSERNHQKLIRLITQLTSRVLESQSTWLELFQQDKQRFQLKSHINLTQGQLLNNPFTKLEGFNKSLVEKKKPIVINDITQIASLKNILQWKNDIRSLIAAPMFSSRDQLMGIIYAAKTESFGFDADDTSMLESFANQSAIALENADLWQSALEKERLEQELRIARDVQLRLLPQKMLKIPGFEIKAFFLTAYEVGGDFYDFITFKDGQPGIVIGDVSGKGTSAAFYMAEFKGVVQTLSHTENNPQDLVTRANHILFETLERKSFVTAIAGKMDVKNSIFQFVRAGHTPVLYCSNQLKSPQFIQPPGLGIGLDRGNIFDQVITTNEIKLHPGDAIVLFTDGLNEARNRHGEEFGEQRLIRLLQNGHLHSASEIKEKILEAVTDFVEDNPLHDDLTFIVLKCDPE